MIDAWNQFENAMYSSEFDVKSLLIGYNSNKKLAFNQSTNNKIKKLSFIPINFEKLQNVKCT